MSGAYHCVTGHVSKQAIVEVHEALAVGQMLSASARVSNMYRLSLATIRKHVNGYQVMWKGEGKRGDSNPRLTSI